MSIAQAMAQAGPGKRAAYKKYARKKAAKRRGKKKTRKKASKKRRSKKGGKKRRSKKGSKRKTFRTTVKVGNAKMRARCRKGKAFKFSGGSTVLFGKRLTAMRGRCVSIKKAK